MKKIFSTLILLCLFFANISDIFAYKLTIGNEEYSCPGVNKSKKSDTLCIKVAEVCNGQNYNYHNDISFYEANKKLVRFTRDYFDYDIYKELSSDPFEKGQEIYKDNMSKIFECAMNQTKEKTITEIEKSLNTSDPELKLELEEFLAKQREEIKGSDLNCATKKNTSGAINNKDFLKISTYEMCVYQTYLEYLKTDYYGNLSNLAPDNLKGKIINADAMNDTEKKGAFLVLEEQKQGLEKIDQEIAHTYKVFPEAYKTYISFDNNYNVHLWLEILKIDLKVFNKKLKGVLGPLAQLVPKIMNAMKGS